MKTTSLRVLVVDDERPALDELAYLLARDHRVGEVVTSDSATEGLRILQERDVDAVIDQERSAITLAKPAGSLGEVKEISAA